MSRDLLWAATPALTPRVGSLVELPGLLRELGVYPRHVSSPPASTSPPSIISITASRSKPRKVLDQERFTVARQLLAHPRTPIQDIASALCYAGVTAFMHAFRRWTGTTPAYFREDRGVSQS